MDYLLKKSDGSTTSLGNTVTRLQHPDKPDTFIYPCLPTQSLIEKVTENNESPAPGWALDQMARLTIQKPGIEIEMVDLLFKRLQKNSCDVKLKCLRAMHFIARRGSVAFRRAMQRGSQVIRAHLSKLPRSAPTDPTPFSAHLGFTQLSPPPLARPLPVRFSRSVPADSRVLALLRSHPGQPAPGAR